MENFFKRIEYQVFKQEERDFKNRAIGWFYAPNVFLAKKRYQILHNISDYDMQFYFFKPSIS